MSSSRAPQRCTDAACKGIPKFVKSAAGQSEYKCPVCGLDHVTRDAKAAKPAKAGAK